MGAFNRKHRNARRVAAAIPAEWTQVERIVDNREDPARGVQYLVKWRGLDYGHCTWEPATEVDKASVSPCVNKEKCCSYIYYD